MLKVSKQLIVPGIYFPVGMESWGKTLKEENILGDLKDKQDFTSWGRQIQEWEA